MNSIIFFLHELIIILINLLKIGSCLFLLSVVIFLIIVIINAIKSEIEYLFD